MAISARLSRTLHHTLGDPAADDLVNWMAKVEASRSELGQLMEVHGARMDARFAEAGRAMDARFAESRRLTDERFAAVDVRFESQHGSMLAGFAQLEARMERRFADLLKWSFVFWVGAVGAIAALAGVFRTAGR